MVCAKSDFASATSASRCSSSPGGATTATTRIATSTCGCRATVRVSAWFGLGSELLLRGAIHSVSCVRLGCKHGGTPATSVFSGGLLLLFRVGGGGIFCGLWSLIVFLSLLALTTSLTLLRRWSLFFFLAFGCGRLWPLLVLVARLLLTALGLLWAISAASLVVRLLPVVVLGFTSPLLILLHLCVNEMLLRTSTIC